MSKYYFLDYSTDENEVGCYMQTKGVPKGHTVKWFEQQNSMTKLSNNFYPDSEPELLFELEEKAFLTDVVSPSNIRAKGLLVNQKVRDILSTFNLIEHKFYPAILCFENINYTYYWLHPIKKDLEGIDFKKSKFIVTNFAFMKESDIELNSYSDYIETKKKLTLKHIRAEKIVLKESFLEKKVDFFFFPLIHSKIFISENIFYALISSKISGICTEEQDILIL